MLFAPEEGEGVADEGGVEVGEAFEVEFEAVGRFFRAALKRAVSGLLL